MVNNKIRNCPLLESDIVNAEDIFGKKLQVLKGRTTNQKSMHLQSYIAKIPITVLEKYQQVTLTGDIMYVNGIRFLLTKSRYIKFLTVKFIQTAKAEELFECLIKV